MANQKTIVITGASSGLGAIAARELAHQGWDVAVVGRNPERTKAVATAVGGTPFLADYDRLDDVRALANALLTKYPNIDVLANNAGGLVGKRGTTADGHERTFQHNHLAPFLLTGLLTEDSRRAGRGWSIPRAWRTCREASDSTTWTGHTAHTSADGDPTEPRNSRQSSSRANSPGERLSRRIPSTPGSLRPHSARTLHSVAP
ncbi:MAG TPA: SDR family NAD(P)-dependent oxidoreductase [Galbitalea sp.]|nr:SDR family NAD(P)-dependent oxidoreductase [Galbitalea sp.]